MEDKWKPVNVASPTHNFPRKPGKTLPNGAIILAEKVIRRYEYRQDSIVLAVNPGGHQPFVSWHRMITTDSPLATGGFHVIDSTCYGHYYSTLERAWENFLVRVAEHEWKLEQDEANAEGKERVANDHA